MCTLRTEQISPYAAPWLVYPDSRWASLPTRAAPSACRAIQMICSDERFTADNALELWLVDEVVAADLQTHAIALAEQVGSKA